MLVAVLWIVAALATLASIFSIYAVNSAVAARIPEDRLRAEAAIRSGVALAAASILAKSGVERPSRGAFETMVGQTKIALRFGPEAARIDLNKAPKELLAGLFSALQVDAGKAAYFAERIVAWRTPADARAANAEAALYREARLPYAPRQAPFDNCLELALVLGLPAPLVEQISPFVTVYSGEAKIDVVDADRQVLAALPGMTPDVAARVIAARESARIDGEAILKLVGPARHHASVDPGKTVRLAIAAVIPRGRRVEAEVVFRLRDDGEAPYDILYWRDDFDGAAHAL